MKESHHELRFVRYVESLGYDCLKLRIDGQDGFPDRTVITPQGVVFIEFKKVGGRLRPQQRRRIKRLQELKQAVCVAWSYEEAKEYFDRWISQQTSI